MNSQSGHAAKGPAPITTVIALVERFNEPGRVPVIFNGREPRIIGDIDVTLLSPPSQRKWAGAADALLVAHRLSATYVSRAQTPSKRYFIVAHG